MRASVTGRALLALGIVATLTGVGMAQPLNRQLPAYCLFAMRELSAKNLTVNGACNVGVNCAQPNASSSCGSASFQNPFFAPNSQLAADVVRISRAGATFWQLFRNSGPPIDGATFGVVGPNPDKTFPLSPLPILGDADGDGTPSCATVSNSCEPDPGDLAAACAFPPVFLDCGGPQVTAAGGDCVGAPDATPGNDRCDLPPGVYGNLNARNGSELTFIGGDYAFCTVTIGRNVTVDATVAARLFISGGFNVNNGTDMGLACGKITAFIRGPGAFSIGRGASVVGTYCAPMRKLLLGAGSNLKGTFAGDRIAGDHNIRVEPCGGIAGGLICSCFDSFSPAVASPGDVVTFVSADCDLRNIDSITVCGVAATILAGTTASELRITVPNGVSGSCPVAAISTAGTFQGALPLVVQ